MGLVAHERAITHAQALFAAESNLLDAEHRIEAELDRVFGDDWQGWNFSRADQMIEVYSACDLPESVAELIELGFGRVRIHAHSAERWVSCSCPTHWARQ